MEAPKVIQHFENLDAQHDQPGLQAPVYHDIHGFDDDDIEDDDQALPQEDYENNKVQVNNYEIVANFFHISHNLT